MTETLLSLRDVSVNYRVTRGFRSTVVPAVKQFDLSIGRGQTVGLIGESGSGKTTITNAILGMVPIASGVIEFGGAVVCDAASRRFRATHQRDIQVVLQDPMSSFNPRYRLRSSLGMPMRIHNVARGDALRERLDALVRKVGLAPALLDKYPHQLSGGQLQRLSIARAISVAPKLIIADEPASKLDVSVRAQVLNLLKDILEESHVALLLITHDLDVARYLCSDLAVMRRGEVLEKASTFDLFDRPSHDYTRTLLESSGWVAAERLALSPSAA